MSDVIARMRLESQDFDNKLKSATANLQHMEREVRRTGATFEYADKEELEFLQSLGQMETKALDAKGKIKELSNSYKELAMMYERMTDAEKASEPGKALAASLQQLKTRLEDTKQSFASVSAEIGEGGGGLSKVMETLGNKIGIPAGAFTALGGAMAAGAAAVKVASDAFKQNEEFMDEWGRTTEAAGTVYQGFLNALNTGDLGGFLRNIGNIISKSREAYDAMDQLGTFNAFNQIQIEGARTDFTEAMANYREGSGSKEDVKAAAEKLKTEMQSRQDKEQAAYIAAIKELAASRGVDEEMLQKALSGTYGDYETLKNTPLARHEEQIWNGNMYGNTTTTKVTWSADTMEQKLGEALRKLNDDELAHIQSLGAQAQRTATEIAQVDKQTVRVLGANRKTATTSTTTTKAEEKAPEGSIKAMREQLSGLQKDWELATDDDRRKVLKDQIDEVSAALDKMIGKTKEAQQVTKAEPLMNFSEKGLANLGSQIKGKMSGAEIGSADYKLAADQLLDFTTFENLLKAATERGVQPDPEWMASLFEDIKIGADVDPETWQAVVDHINELIEGTEFPSIDLDVKTGKVEAASEAAVSNAKDTASAWQNAVAAVNNVGSALQQIEDPAAKVSGIVMQAIANVALGFAQASASAATGAAGVFGWIAAATAGVATMVSTIAAIKSATAGSYASGGIVPGSSFSGDNLTANVNSGELILNRAQQGAIAGQLQGAAQQTVMVEGRISGKDILLSANNTNRAAGGSRGYYTKVK